MAIEFTQYLLPDGRRTTSEIERGAEVEAKAREIIDAGYRFECEVLRTGHVSLTIADPREEEDVAIVVVPNGPGIGEAVDKLVSEFRMPAAA